MEIEETENYIIQKHYIIKLYNTYLNNLSTQIDETKNLIKQKQIYCTDIFKLYKYTKHNNLTV